MCIVNCPGFSALFSANSRVLGRHRCLLSLGKLSILELPVFWGTMHIFSFLFTFFRRKWGSLIRTKSPSLAEPSNIRKVSRNWRAIRHSECSLKVVIGKRLPLRTSVVNCGPFITDETHPFCWDSSVTVAQRWLFWILEEPLPNSTASPKSHVQVITDGTSDLKDCWVMRVMPWGISRGESLRSLMICPRTSGDAHQICFWS